VLLFPFRPSHAPTGEGSNANWSAGVAAELPPGPTSEIPTSPVPRGLVAIICLADETVTLRARVRPKLTAIPRTKPLPVIVTRVPPACGPLLGDIAAITGAARAAAGVAADARSEVSAMAARRARSRGMGLQPE
jgi:hypothetical protein